VAEQCSIEQVRALCLPLGAAKAKLVLSPCLVRGTSEARSAEYLAPSGVERLGRPSHPGAAARQRQAVP
jgi:hypothetical protein